jgi:hypothetical protein
MASDVSAWTHKLSFLVAFVAGSALFCPQAAAAIESGRLTITDISVAPIDSSAVAADSLRLLTVIFSLGVTDATATKAGWHIQAMLGPPTRTDGTPVPVHSTTVTETRVITLTGRPPTSLLSYPGALRASGDTIFSAAGGSGMGKSSLALTTGIVIAADAADDAPLTASMTVTIATGP